MKESISHKGRIVEVTPEFTTVEIVSESACSACHAKGLCGLGESREKAIQLPTRGWDSYAPGDEVEVVLEASMGHKAVWLAYVMPLFVLLTAFFVLHVSGASDLVAGLSAIGAVAIYYMVLAVFRDKLKNQYVFTIK